MKALKRVQTILKSSDVQDLNFSSYNFNKNENLILLETETEKIFTDTPKKVYFMYTTYKAKS